MKAIGDPEPRRDGRDKVTGAARYSYEVPTPGVAYAVLITSGIARGRLVDVDVRAALREPGVLAVLTPANAPRLPGKTHGEPPDRVVQVLQDDRIWFSNQPIAVAVADTFERAVHASLTVRVRTEAFPHTVRMIDELQNGIAHSVVSGGRASSPDALRGDVEKAQATATARIDQIFETPPETHNPMEPHATVAIWEAPDRLNVFDSTQSVFGVRRKLAAAFDLPLDHVRVRARFVGGAFGCKGSAWSHVLIAALAAKHVGRPVKLVLSRPQMFGMVGGRPQTRQRVTLGADATGKLVALRHQSHSTTSRFDFFVEPSAGQAGHLYASPNIETTQRVVQLDIGTPTFMRAPGESSGSFALESALDELAHALSIDPIALRLTNYAKRDPIDDRPFSSKGLRTCYEEGARRFGWERRSPTPATQQRDGLQIGMGMATAAYPVNYSKAHAEARIHRDGTAEVESGTIEVGNGAYTAMAQVAADALGLPFDRVRFDLGDTAMPEAPVTAGSLSAASVGSAVLVACRSLRDRLVKLSVADPRSPLHGIPAQEVQAAAGRFTARGLSDSHAEIVQRAGEQMIVERGEAGPGEERKKYAMLSHGAQFAEVAVDPDLGIVRVVRLVGVFAGGRVLNARTARSQLLGGMVWGISMALHEHSVYDEKLGRIMSRDFADYHIPTQADVGAIEPYLIEEFDAEVDPVGVKGLGEIGICGCAAAIANAVFNATGKRIRALPITADKLL
jgi:xanthine dehydrogenase YagR molybdenum-binding subunit